MAAGFTPAPGVECGLGGSRKHLIAVLHGAALTSDGGSRHCLPKMDVPVAVMLTQQHDFSRC